MGNLGSRFRLSLVEPFIKDLVICTLVVAVLCHLLVEGLANLLVLSLGSLAGCLHLLIPALATSHTSLHTICLISTESTDLTGIELKCSRIHKLEKHREETARTSSYLCILEA